MTLDARFHSDEKKFISPVVQLSNFLVEALYAEESLCELLAPVDDAEDEGEEDEQTVKREPSEACDQLGEARQHCRSTFKAAGYGGLLVDEAIDEVLDEFEFIRELTLADAHYEMTIPPQDTGLYTHLELMRVRYGYPTTVMKNALVGRGKYFKWKARHLKTTSHSGELTQGKDLIITASLLAPQNREPEKDEIVPYRNRCEVKLLLRGETRLRDLCDAIVCPSSLWSSQAAASGVQHDTDFDHGALFPAGFLFIHDTFYDDERHGGAGRERDASRTTREFINRKRGQFGRYKRRDLGGVRVSDLSLRLGQPYLFKHQGECEHLIVFSDLRLLNAQDEHPLAHYPLKVFDNRLEMLCCVCERAMATRVVTDGRGLLPSVPAHFCACCFEEFFGPRPTRRCEARFYRNTQLGGER